MCGVPKQTIHKLKSVKISHGKNEIRKIIKTNMRKRAPAVVMKVHG